MSDLFNRGTEAANAPVFETCIVETMCDIPLTCRHKWNSNAFLLVSFDKYTAEAFNAVESNIMLKEGHKFKTRRAFVIRVPFDDISKDLGHRVQHNYPLRTDIGLAIRYPGINKYSSYMPSELCCSPLGLSVVRNEVGYDYRRTNEYG